MAKLKLASVSNQRAIIPLGSSIVLIHLRASWSVRRMKGLWLR